MKNIIVLVCFISLFSCKPQQEMKPVLAFDESPQWAQEAIWYQIFVERFRNGNTANEPTPKYMQPGLFDTIPSDWKMQDWGSNWYGRAAWEEGSEFPFYTTVQMRRYGGDLEGVKSQIAYLKDLGINAVYFNPLNDAPSLHKYDARSYHHIDINFGPDPEGDIKLIASEKPEQPETWVWTSADKLFLEVIDQMHKEGIRVVLDFSFNHTGRAFWAFEDILKNQQQSPFKDWFEIKEFDNLETKEIELDYDGWFGIKSLPELKKIRSSEKKFGNPFEGDIVDPVKQHIFAVCRRWMDPNGDGNFQDGIDGIRLDVAEHVPLGFWRSFRKEMRSINPEFYLIGECWWEEFPERLMDPSPWVQGDIFDAVMHYHWYKPARALFRNPEGEFYTLTSYRDHVKALWSKYKPSTARSMMNLNASHDSPRFWTSINNTNMYKLNAKPNDNAYYKTGAPDAEAIAMGKALLLHQFTFIGSPHIWNGDEMGMFGADDPDNRKPLWWKDITFEPETNHPASVEKYEITPGFNEELFNYYKSLIGLRKSEAGFSWGSIDFIDEYLEMGILAYVRSYENKTLLVMINPSKEERQVQFITGHENKTRIFTLGQVEKGLFAGYSGIVFEIKK
ncbi:MAG: hypothetical protein KDC49_18625 [Saprospiraceae bacterium]|nr:hypothetical protein [Saprospiraceae bacterium]